MAKKELYVGNMPFSMTEDQMRELFSPYGTIESLVLKVDKFTGRSRGYGFVTFSTEEEATAAAEALNGNEVEYTFVRDGVEEKATRALVVNESRPQEEGASRPRNSFNNRRGGNFRGNRDRRFDRGDRRPRYDDNGFEMAA